MLQEVKGILWQHFQVVMTHCYVVDDQGTCYFFNNIIMELPNRNSRNF